MELFKTCLDRLLGLAFCCIVPFVTEMGYATLPLLFDKPFKALGSY